MENSIDPLNPGIHEYCGKCGYTITGDHHVISKLTQKMYYDLELMQKEEGEQSEWMPLCFNCFNGMERTADDEPTEVEQSNLINCPDCGKEVSHRAVSCPNCGCPIGEIDTHACKPAVIQKTQKPDQNITHIPKCPTCQSTNVEKISLTSKLGKVALVGVFAIGKVSKTFKCNACGYQW